MISATDPPSHGDKLTIRIRARIGGLSASLVRVVEFIDSHRLDALTLSAAEIGAATGTSDATVIRAVKALGFDGFKNLKQELAASFGQGQSAADNMARTFSGLDDTLDGAIERVLADHGAALQALVTAEARSQMAAAVKLLSSARRIGVFGIGPSSHLARYFALQVSRIGRPARVFDGSRSPLADQLLAMSEVDAVVMLAYGRPYKEAMACVSEARRLRKRILLITDFEDLGLVRHASEIVTVHRGQPGRVALHGATFVCLEAILLALASRQKDKTVTTLGRLNELRKSLGKSPTKY